MQEATAIMFPGSQCVPLSRIGNLALLPHHCPYGVESFAPANAATMARALEYPHRTTHPVMPRSNAAPATR